MDALPALIKRDRLIIGARPCADRGDRLVVHDLRSAPHGRHRRLRVRRHEDGRTGTRLLVRGVARAALPDVGDHDGSDDAAERGADDPDLRRCRAESSPRESAIRSGGCVRRRLCRDLVRVQHRRRGRAMASPSLRAALDDDGQLERVARRCALARSGRVSIHAAETELPHALPRTASSSS